MDIQQVVDDTKYSVRTQISLSRSLHRLVKKKAKEEEKSMAAIIREKLLKQIQKEEKEGRVKKQRLVKLTEKVREIRESGQSGWAKVKDPHALIRKWRREEDEKRMKRIGLKP